MKLLCESETISGSQRSPGSSSTSSASSGHPTANGGRSGNGGGLKLGIVRLGRAAGKVGLENFELLISLYTFKYTCPSMQNNYSICFKEIYILIIFQKCKKDHFLCDVEHIDCSIRHCSKKIFAFLTFCWL